MTWLINSIRAYPELALFLTLAIGYAVGKIKIGSFKIGSVTGVLITGVVIGQLNITINPTVKSVFFLLFLFTLGYNSGPQFFKGLRKDGIPQVIFAIIVCISGLISTVIVGKLLGYNAGQATGLAAGALTQSSIIGVAQDSISKLSLPSNEIKNMMDFVPVGYAVTYIFGTAGTVFILSTIAPKILGVNLEDECKIIESNFKNSAISSNLNSNISDIEYRAFIIDEHFAGKSVLDIEKTVSTNSVRSFIIRIKHNDSIFTAKEDTILNLGDKIVFSFKSNDMKNISLSSLGKEIFDLSLLNFPTEKLSVYVKSKKVIGKSIDFVKKSTLTRGVYISKLNSNGEDLFYDKDTILNHKDILTLSGPKDIIENLSYKIGTPIFNTSETDMIFVSLGILLGGLIGIPSLVLGGIKINLSTSGGALIMGLIFGFIHSRRPQIGHIPIGTTWFLSNVGLTAFVAVVGINAGPGFVSGIKTSGISFLIAGIVVTTIPIIVGILIGKYIFKWKVPIILGACAGSMTTTAAVGAICEKSKSNIPVLGYTVTYAVSNIVLTIWGSILIFFF